MTTSKETFAGEPGETRRYLYFAEGRRRGLPDVAALFIRSPRAGPVTFGHFDFLAEVGDPVTPGVARSATDDNLKSAVASETYMNTPR